MLTADIEFLHTVLGLQSCSAMYPCFICLIKLDQLRKERSTSNGEDRTPEIFAAHLAEVLQCSSWNEKKKKARVCGSVIQKALIPIHIDRVMLPVLHLILGIVKKLLG